MTLGPGTANQNGLKKFKIECNIQTQRIEMPRIRLAEQSIEAFCEREAGQLT